MTEPFPPCADCGHGDPHLEAMGCLHDNAPDSARLSDYCPCPTYVPPTPVVVSSPTLERARVERDAAMAQVERGTDPEWELTAAGAVTWCAANLPDGFTPDDVWARLESLRVPPPREPRALGPILQRALKRGAIDWTGGYSASTRRHTAPVRVYVQHHA